jgi:hypothetical protein
MNPLSDVAGIFANMEFEVVVEDGSVPLEDAGFVGVEYRYFS